MIKKVKFLRDYEQGIDQLNRLNSVDAKLDIEPAKEEGMSDVIINVKRPHRPVAFVLEYDNNGQQSTGEDQKRLGFNIDNMLGLNDYVSLSYTKSNNHDGGNEDNKQRAFSLYIDVPYHKYNFTYSNNYSRYNSIVSGLFGDFDLVGYSRVNNFAVSRLLYRNQSAKLHANASIRYLNNDTYLADNKLETSSYDVASANMGISYLRYTGGGVFSSSVTYHRGLDIINAEEKFDKYSAQVSWQKRFNRGGINWEYSSSLYGQYSEDDLIANEELNIGSAYTVRGFKENSSNGDKGFYWRNQGGVAIGIDSAWIDEISPYVAVDYGRVRRDGGKSEHGDFADVDMVGAAIGVRTSGRLNVRAEYSKPIHEPVFASNNKGEFLLSVTINMY
jgi:hemolysin activation/secretion protein